MSGTAQARRTSKGTGPAGNVTEQFFFSKATSEASRLSAFLWIPSLWQQITVINTTLFVFLFVSFFFTAFTEKEKNKVSTLWNCWDAKQPWSEDYLITKMHLTTVQVLPCRLNFPKCSVFNRTRKKQNCCTRAGNECFAVQWGLSTI